MQHSLGFHGYTPSKLSYDFIVFCFSPFHTFNNHCAFYSSIAFALPNNNWNSCLCQRDFSSHIWVYVLVSYHLPVHHTKVVWEDLHFFPFSRDVHHHLKRLCEVIDSTILLELLSSTYTSLIVIFQIIPMIFLRQYWRYNPKCLKCIR